MAVIAWDEQVVTYKNSRLYRCSAMHANDNSVDLILPRHRDVTIHITGTFDGATLEVRGSNDLSGSITYDVLDDVFGDPLVFGIASKKLRQFLPIPYRLNVTVVGGGGSTNINAALRMGTMT